MAWDRPWKPFKRIDIRLTATNKMIEQDKSDIPVGRREAKEKANALDTVRGCPGGAINDGRGCHWGCYSCDAMKRFHILFHEAVSMNLKPHLLRKDLENCPDDWIRIGINGDPGEDWNLTLETCGVIAEYNKRPVVLTRLWTLPEQDILEGLARTKTVLHVTTCALDSGKMIENALNVLRRYQTLGGTAVMRLVTFLFQDKDLLKMQDQLYYWGGFILEQPARIKRTNPNWYKVQRDNYKPYHDYTTKKVRNIWWTAGSLYNGPTCGDGCKSCPNKCYTNLDRISEWLNTATPVLLHLGVEA